jgi:hypothetical protein
MGMDTSSYERLTGPKGIRLQSALWNMSVSDDGNTVRVRLKGTTAVPVPRAGQPGTTAIENAARQFIAAQLSEFVKLRADEELVPLDSRYSHVSGRAAQATVSDPIRTTGWSMAFGRSVGGELIIGGGAIVAVIFRADNTVEGFDFDWPQYQVSTIQAAMDLSGIRARAQQIEQQRGNPPVSREVLFECGLFDPGGKSPRRRLQLVQAGCVQAYAASGATGSVNTEAGIVVAIPGAQTPIMDAKWPEMATLCGDGTIPCQTAGSRP